MYIGISYLTYRMTWRASGWRAAGGRLASGWRAAGDRLASNWRAESGWREANGGDNGRAAGKQLASGWRAAGERLASGWRAAGEQTVAGERQHAAKHPPSPPFAILHSHHRKKDATY